MPVLSTFCASCAMRQNVQSAPLHGTILAGIWANAKYGEMRMTKSIRNITHLIVRFPNIIGDIVAPNSTFSCPLVSERPINILRLYWNDGAEMDGRGGAKKPC